jgi:hypothetical protein
MNMSTPAATSGAPANDPAHGKPRSMHYTPNCPHAQKVLPGSANSHAKKSSLRR